MPTFTFRALAAAGVALAALASAAADEVYLRDGRMLEGEVISAPDAAVVDLKAGSGSLVAISHFERAQVLRIAFGVSAREQGLQELRARRTALGNGGEAEEWWSLSQHARDLGDTLMAKECASETLARDRDHAEAAKLLGLSRSHGIWMRANEVATDRGEVLFRGRWMSWAARDQLLAEEARSRAEALSEFKAREENRRIAAAQAQIEAGSGLAPETSLQPTYPQLYPQQQSGVFFGNTGSGFGRSVFWQNAYAPACAPFIGVHASGGGAHSSWSFNWGF
jgi:hypothetical protein